MSEAVMSEVVMSEEVTRGVWMSDGDELRV